MNLSRLAVHAAASYRWNRSRQHRSGRWGPEAPLDCTAYYKVPWSFEACGDLQAAERSLAHIESTYLLPNGDLDKVLSQTLLERHPLYPHAHVAIGAARAGRLDLADRILEFLAAQRHQGLNAWGDRQDAGEFRRCDTISTACVGLAFLERGKLELARGAVQFLSRILQAQPHPEKDFIYSMTPDGVLESRPLDGNSPPERCVRFGKRFQVWWAISFPAILLTQFSRVAAEPEARQTALRYMALLEGSGQAWSDLSAGKIALACALLYLQGGDPTHRAGALKACRAIVSRLSANGGWNACHGGEGGTSRSPTALGHEVNLEFALVLSSVGRCLAERDGSVFKAPSLQEKPNFLQGRICACERMLLSAARERAYQFHASGPGRWLHSKR